MIPLRDINPRQGTPAVTYALIGVNALIFFYQLSLNMVDERSFIMEFGLVPSLLWDDPVSQWPALISSMFMHGGWLHLIGNMWFLYIFGDNIEDNLGHGRFLLFYICCGVSAALVHVLINSSSPLPMVGASGAVSGLIAGYVKLFPRTKILTLVPIFIFVQFVELPVVVFVFLWFGYQLLMGLGSLGTLGQQMGGVAFFAHIGGFIAGLFWIRRFYRKPNPRHGFRSH